VTAAQRAAAARALGITVPAWRGGEIPYFDLNPSGSIDTNSCVPPRRGQTRFHEHAWPSSEPTMLTVPLTPEPLPYHH